MIPIRVSLAGFLCYREEQTFLFDGAPLWVISGPNGAGKSSVFDAVTFALYGKLRDGGYRLEDLLNHQADQLLAEFDFETDGTVYRVRRTRARRGRPTFGAFRLVVPADDGDPLIEAIDDTDSEDGLHRWVAATIGLSFKTFTSSVLLRQGKSDQLLTEDPRDRFQILEELVDLSRYRRLHALVDQRRVELDHQVRAASQLLTVQPPVTDGELTATQADVDRAKQAMTYANREAERLTTLLELAKQARDLRESLARLERVRAEDRALIDREDEIQRGRERRDELGQNLPDLKKIVRGREHLEDLRNQIADDDEAIATLEAGASDAERAAALARKEGDGLTKRVDALQDKLTSLQSTMTLVAPLVTKLEELEGYEQDIDGCREQLKRLPEDLDALLAAAEQRVAYLAEVSQALPWLDDVSQARTDLAAALTSVGDAERVLEEMTHSMADQALRLSAAEDAVAAAEEAHQTANGDLIRAAERLDGARNRLRRFEETAAEPVCGVCGQPITPEHAAGERTRLTEHVEEETLTVTSAQRAKERAEQAGAAVKDAHAALLADCEALSTQLRQHEQAEGAARQEVLRCDVRLRRAYQRLPNSYRERVAAVVPVVPMEPVDWLETSYPTLDELDVLHREDAAKDEKEVALERLAEQCQERTNINGQIEALTKRVKAIEAVHGRVKLIEAREQQVVLAQQRDDLARRSASCREERDRAQTIATERAQALDAARQALTDREGRRRSAEATVEVEEAHLGDALCRLLPEWRLLAEGATQDDLAEREEEYRRLGDYPLLWEDLLAARGRTVTLKNQEAERRSELARLPVEALEEEPAAVEAELQQMKECQDQAAAEHVKHGQTLAQLQERRCQYVRLEQQRAEADRERHLHQTLGTHLGSRGLLRHLLRHAEQAIVEEANDILDRLSDGRMRLHVRPEDGAQTDKALDLLVRDLATGTKEEPISLVSGSQRFRISVSLALAIGRYLGRESRRIQSVIIDEGFGSLDREGRTTMIQELERLQGELRRIILITHQEEISEAFPNSYAVSLVDGASSVVLVTGN